MVLIISAKDSLGDLAVFLIPVPDGAIIPIPATTAIIRYLIRFKLPQIHLMPGQLAQILELLVLPPLPVKSSVPNVMPVCLQGLSFVSPAALLSPARLFVPAADGPFRQGPNSARNAALLEADTISFFKMLRPVGHIGSYTVVKPIGRGKYGVCYKAFKSDGHPVVLKRFYKNPTKGRFAPDDHEAVILSGLEHPAIPEFLGVLNEKAGYFFVLEYKNGMTLEQIIFKHRHRFCDDEIFNVGSQLLKIMSYIHSRNVIHGDLRLSNIIMDDNGHISLIDFGLARYTGEDGLLPGQRAYLMRLLRLTEPFTSDTAVVEGFRKNFSIN